MTKETHRDAILARLADLPAPDIFYNIRGTTIVWYSESGRSQVRINIHPDSIDYVADYVNRRHSASGPIDDPEMIEWVVRAVQYLVR